LEQLYRISDVARILGLNRQTATKWIREGRIEAVRFGTHRTAPWRVTKSALERFIIEHVTPIKVTIVNQTEPTIRHLKVNVVPPPAAK
jgi:excisionase family DNA binding protein